MNKKPREFWLEIGGDPSDDKECYKRYSSATPFVSPSNKQEVIHLIEYSAYKTLLKRIEDLEDTIIDYMDKHEV